MPIAVELLGREFATTAHMSYLEVARLVLMTVLAPILTGIVFRSGAPAFAERIAQPMSLIATVLLFSCAVAVLFSAWPAIVSLIGNGTIGNLPVTDERKNWWISWLRRIRGGFRK